MSASDEEIRRLQQSEMAELLDTFTALATVMSGDASGGPTTEEIDNAFVTAANKILTNVRGRRGEQASSRQAPAERRTNADRDREMFDKSFDPLRVDAYRQRSKAPPGLWSNDLSADIAKRKRGAR